MEFDSKLNSLTMLTIFDWSLGRKIKTKRILFSFFLRHRRAINAYFKMNMTLEMSV